MQTIIRRLTQWTTQFQALNPFIENSGDNQPVGHSMATTSPESHSPKPIIQESDTVVAGPEVLVEGPLSFGYVATMAKVVALTDFELGFLRNTDLATCSRSVKETLRAVRHVG